MALTDDGVYGIQLSLLFGAGAMMFDVFKTWRLDSGDYAKFAEVVISAWEGRCQQLHNLGIRPEGTSWERPALMHSNLKDVEHVQQVAK